MARYLTRQRILTGLRRHYKKHGYFPRTTDTAKIAHLPSAATVQKRLCGNSWSDAMRIAAREIGVEYLQRPSRAGSQRRIRWTQRRTQRRVGDYFDEHGHFPLSSEVPRGGCIAIMRNLEAKSWESAINKMAAILSVPPVHHPNSVFAWDRPRVLEGLRSYYEVHGHFPRTTDVSGWDGLPTAATIQDRLGTGSWAEAVEIAAQALRLSGEMRPVKYRESSIKHPTPFRHKDGHFWVRDPSTGKKMRYTRYLAQKRSSRVLGPTEWVVQLDGNWDNFSEDNLRVMTPQDYYSWRSRVRR